MTDKPIIIDGVDVSKCNHYCNKLGYCNSAEFLKFDDEPIKTHYYCEEKSNCHYKQLQRKTAECEELKEELTQEKQRNNDCFPRADRRDFK